MGDRTTTKTTVRVNEQFADELREMYPAATSVPKALLAAAQDGVDFRRAVGGDLEAQIHDIVDERLEQHDAPRARSDD